MRIVAWPGHGHRAHNPYQSLLYEAMERHSPDVEVVEFRPSQLLRRRRPDIFHVHWPDAFLAAARSPIEVRLRALALRSLVALSRWRGIKVVWTAHNFGRPKQRNGNELDAWLWPWFLRAVDGIIFLNRASRLLIEGRYPHVANVDSVVIPLLHYRDIAPPVPTADHGGAPHVVSIGSTAAYKNVGRVVGCFLELPAGSLRLTVAGKPSQLEPDHELERLVGSLPSTHTEHLDYRPVFVPDAELVSLIAAADGAVFAYESVMNSAAAILALSVGRPVLAPRCIAFAELQDLVGSDWVHLYDGELEAASLGSFATAVARRRGEVLPPDLSALDPARSADATRAFFASLERQARGRG